MKQRENRIEIRWINRGMQNAVFLSGINCSEPMIKTVFVLHDFYCEGTQKTAMAQLHVNEYRRGEVFQYHPPAGNSKSPRVKTSRYEHRLARSN